MSGFDSWFEERAETRRLDLGDGKWIDVAKYLTGEERLIIQSAGLRGVKREKDPHAEALNDDENKDDKESVIQIDAVRQKFARMQVYIKGWSATKSDGTPMPCNLSSFRRLSEPALEAIDKALDKHVEEMREGKAVAPPTGAASSTSASISEG